MAIGGTQSSEHEAAFPSLDSSRGNAQSSGLVVSPELLTHRADDAEDQQENSLKLQQGKESRSEKPQPGQDIPSMVRRHNVNCNTSEEILKLRALIHQIVRSSITPAMDLLAAMSIRSP